MPQQEVNRMPLSGYVARNSFLMSNAVKIGDTGKEYHHCGTTLIRE
ncbi:hypothetical protein [Photorhabdus sp. SF281]